MHWFHCQGPGIPATAVSSYFSLMNVKNLLILEILIVPFQRRCYKAVDGGAGRAERSSLLLAGLTLGLARCWCLLASLLKQAGLSILDRVASLLDTFFCQLSYRCKPSDCCKL